MLGVYLRRVNGGMILYAGVREAYRRQGLYTEMRGALLGGLDEQSPTGLGFVLSEVEDGSWLHRKYLDEWGGFDAPLDYVQPAVQGLSRRRLDLMVVPQAVGMADDHRESANNSARGVYGRLSYLRAGRRPGLSSYHGLSRRCPERPRSLPRCPILPSIDASLN